MIPLSRAGVRTTGGLRFLHVSSVPVLGRSAFLPKHRIQSLARRWVNSDSQTTTKVPEQARTIPAPFWLWLEPAYEPIRAYGRIQQRRPYWTQFISALVIYFIGDVIAQSITPPSEEETDTIDDRSGIRQWAEDRDWARTARALVIGGAAAVPSYRWFLWLGTAFNYPSKVLSLATKVIVNQTTFTIAFNTYFFSMQSLLSGASLSATIERVKNTVPTSWINSCKLWPAVTAFMFVYVPIQYRSIIGGVIAIGWQTYLNLLNQRAAARERGLDASDGVTGPAKQEEAIQPRSTLLVTSGQERQKCAA